MTDPPIYADIGESTINVENFGVSVDMKSFLHSSSSGDSLELMFDNFEVTSGATPFFDFDG